MTDPRRTPQPTDVPERSRQGAESEWGTSIADYPPYPDPAYAGQLPTYGTGYPPQYAPNPTAPLPRQQWTASQPAGGWGAGQPPGGPPGNDEGGPPPPRRSPPWLWLLAGGAVLLVVGLVVALMMVNESTKTPTAGPELPTIPTTTPVPSTQVPRVPSTTPRRPSRPSPTRPGPSTVPPPPRSGAAQTIGYSVSGQGRVISIAYVDTGGVLQTEFNVTLPWSKEVSLEPPASEVASVTVVNVGQEVTCSLTVDGEQVRERTGTILTICTAAS